MMFVLAFAVSASPTITVPPSPEMAIENSVVQFDITSTLGTGTNEFTMNPTYGTLVRVDDTRATFTWTPGYDEEGTYTITFTVTDDVFDTDSKNVTIIVANKNRAPTITSSAVTTVEVGETYHYDVDAEDLDADTLEYELVTKPNGMVIDINSGVITWSPDFTDINGNNVVVKVTDDGSGLLTDTQSFSIDVVALEIDKLEVFVAEDDERLDNRDTFDARVGDEVSFEITVENLFSGDTDDEEVDIENVEITLTVEGWDDGHDEDFDSEDFDIDYDDKETITITLGSVPIDMDEGKHDVTIEIKGEDENNVDHEIEWTVFMDVEKNREDIRLTSISLEPSIVSCNRNPILTVRLTNAGTKDSDEIVLEVKHTLLGISIQDYDIDMDEGDKETIQHPLHIMGDVAPGTYSIRVSTYFDLDDFDDQDVSESENVELIVQNCAVVEPEPEEEDVVIVVPPEEDEEEPVEPAKGSLFSVNNAYLAGLILVNILLILGIIFLVMKVFRR